MSAVIRCAVYTRKSSEEGLEQSFNSIEAQYEACRAFILSQKHESWTVGNQRYDDGGFSGGTLERPALKRLLTDVQDRKIDVVVVYKVDRLTRSLVDFAKIVEVFDSAQVSFVSVTQQFNTTTSMGRLTLNVLLSFAQYERELTGERIRDKIAASKKKGMWMGGLVPLGYDVLNRKLVINPQEAAKVQLIFNQYLQLGSVQKLQHFLHEEKVVSKLRDYGDKRSGGAAFSRGAVYHILNNRIYVGQICHRKALYPGQHPAIISDELWNQVTARLQAHRPTRPSGKPLSTPSLLTGIVFDSEGIRFTPTHCVKRGRRYRYYTSQAVIQHASDRPRISRFPAEQLERLVRAEAGNLFARPARFTEGLLDQADAEVLKERSQTLATEWSKRPRNQQNDLIQKIVKRVIVGASWISVEIDKRELQIQLLNRLPESGPDTSATLKLTLQTQVKINSGEVHVTTPAHPSLSSLLPVASVSRAVILAREWYHLITSGEIPKASYLVKHSGLSPTYVKKILRFINLSPAVSKALLARELPHLRLKHLSGRLPLEWSEQEKRLLSFPSSPDDTRETFPCSEP